MADLAAAELAQLKARVAALEAENAELKNALPARLPEGALAGLDLEQFRRPSETLAAAQDRATRMTAAVATLLEGVGECPARDGLLKTPMRMAKSLMAMTAGYNRDVAEVINGALFDENHDNIVIVRNIEVFSMCEHHMIPFFGHVHIGYIPNGKVLGLSKLARIVDIFSRRLQVQERLTTEIARSLMDTLQPAGVAVVVEAKHMCMMMRGVQKSGAETITSCMLGAFRDDPKTREEFLKLIDRPAR